MRVSTSFFVSAFLAIAEAQNCNLIAHWESHWIEDAFTRYRVGARAETGGSQSNATAMLEQWVKIGRSKLAQSHI